MKRLFKNIVAFILAGAMLGSATAYAVTTFPSGFLIGDDDGIRVTSEGKYFIYADNMEAGDVIRKTLKITNNEHSTFTLSMTAEPLFQTGPIELLNKIHLKLTMDGKVLYNGRLYGDDGTNMITKALPLGTYSYGDTNTLQIELTLDKNLPRDLFRKKSIAEIQWNFHAVKKEDSSPPKTGATANMTLMGLSAVFLAVSFYFYRKKQKSS